MGKGQNPFQVLDSILPGLESLAIETWPAGGSAPARRLPPILAVHGLSRLGADFRRLGAAAAARGRRLAAPDMPGRGRSSWLRDPMLYALPTYVEACLKVAKSLDWLPDLPPEAAATGWAGRLDWVGTSMGGLIGMMLAADPRGPIRRLVLNDVGAVLPAEALSRIRDYLAEPPPRFADLAEAEAHLRQVHRPFGPLTDQDWAEMAEASTRPAPEGESGLVLHYDPAIVQPMLASEPVEIDLWPLWERVRCPVLILRGAESDLLTAEVAARMAENRPEVRVETLPGIGHAPALLDEQQITLVLDWLDEA